MGLKVLPLTVKCTSYQNMYGYVYMYVPMLVMIPLHAIHMGISMRNLLWGPPRTRTRGSKDLEGHYLPTKFGGHLIILTPSSMAHNV